jgi:hypothetical protein
LDKRDLIKIRCTHLLCRICRKLFWHWYILSVITFFISSDKIIGSSIPLGYQNVKVGQWMIMSDKDKDGIFTEYIIIDVKYVDSKLVYLIVAERKFNINNKTPVNGDDYIFKLVWGHEIDEFPEYYMEEAHNYGSNINIDKQNIFLKNKTLNRAIISIDQNEMYRIYSELMGGLIIFGLIRYPIENVIAGIDANDFENLLQDFGEEYDVANILNKNSKGIYDNLIDDDFYFFDPHVGQWIEYVLEVNVHKKKEVVFKFKDTIINIDSVGDGFDITVKTEVLDLDNGNIITTTYTKRTNEYIRAKRMGYRAALNLGGGQLNIIKYSISSHENIDAISIIGNSTFGEAIVSKFIPISGYIKTLNPTLNYIVTMFNR